MLSSWKTSLAGIASILTGASLIISGNLESGIAAVIAGIGLIKAKDAQ